MSDHARPLPLRTRLRHKVASYPWADLIYRPMFAHALPRLAVGRVRADGHPGAGPLGQAIDAITGRGLGPREDRWIRRIEAQRVRFADRPNPILTQAHPDFGRPFEYSPRRVAELASIHRPWGVFLLRLVEELAPASCVELGSAIGISAAYQGAGLELNGSGRLRTVEGVPELARLARENLAALEIRRVEVIEGRFEVVLDDVLAEAAPINLAFVDAGKSREHNLRQFERLLPHLAPGAALILDDVHWSPEMHGVWRKIRGHEQVALSVDLWSLGACLMRTN